jgi:hypothetical protein
MMSVNLKLAIGARRQVERLWAGRHIGKSDTTELDLKN